MKLHKSGNQAKSSKTTNKVLVMRTLIMQVEKNNILQNTHIVD